LHGRFQGLYAILEAAEILRGESQVKFVLIGEGVEKPGLQRFAANRDLSNVTFLEPRPKSDMPAFVASSDIAVVSLLNRMPGTMPSKFYEALAAGATPLVADGCEAAPLVAKYEAGVVYEPGCGRSAADAIRSYMQMTEQKREAMRVNCRALAQRFDRNRLAAIVNDTLNALVAGKALPATDW
jgi:glycosyltransferase involved in cell wall biosynthesis